MLANQTSCIATRRTCLCTEASGVCAIFKRKLCSVENFITVHICNRYFCSRNKEIIGIRNFKRVLFEFRQLSRAYHTVSVNHKRRKNFFISVFARVRVKIKVYNCTFQLCACTAVNGKASAGYFCRCLGVENAEVRA